MIAPSPFSAAIFTCPFDARFANGDGARADEQPRGGDALREVAARAVAHVDDQPRRAALGERRDLRAQLLGRAAAERRDAHVSDAIALLPAFHVDRRRRLARQLDDVRFGRAACRE